ncbi:hypothetical protein PTKIN_Ptkin03bG0126000 [Pterospermum kingtungense]
MDSKLLQSRWLLPILVLLVSSLQNWANAAEPQVPCYFIFGDSLSDGGNNNNRYTLAKVNYKPYGIDFPMGPTGRFSNGRNMQDVIVELLGFEEYITPFASAHGSSILKGVNYASGAAGILDETGKQLGRPVTLNEQINNHKTIISRISQILGEDSSTKKLLSQCIYSVQIGNNDYINNYFKPKFYTSSSHYTPEQFAQVLVEQYSKHIKTLYDDGARKFAIYALGPIGCTPYAVATYGTNGSPCVDKLNKASTLFNNKLKPLAEELSRDLTDAKVIYLNPSPTPADLLSFAVINDSCCKTGGGGGELCLPNSAPCSNRRQYVFWDRVHPTDTYNERVAQSAYQTLVMH